MSPCVGDRKGEVRNAPVTNAGGKAMRRAAVRQHLTQKGLTSALCTK